MIILLAHLHRSFSYCHVQIDQNLVGFRFAAVLFERMSHRDSILLSTPNGSSIVYHRYVCLAAPVDKNKT